MGSTSLLLFISTDILSFLANHRSDPHSYALPIRNPPLPLLFRVTQRITASQWPTSKTSRPPTALPRVPLSLLTVAISKIHTSSSRALRQVSKATISRALRWDTTTSSKVPSQLDRAPILLSQVLMASPVALLLKVTIPKTIGEVVVPEVAS